MKNTACGRKSTVTLLQDIEKQISQLEQGSAAEFMLVGTINNFLNTKILCNDNVIKQFVVSSDPLILSLRSYCKWTLHHDFDDIVIFFKKMDGAITKYSTYETVNSNLFQIFIEKRIQFRHYDDLLSDLLRFEYFLDKVHDYTLVHLKERILKTFVKALIILMKRKDGEKIRAMGLRVSKICMDIEKQYQLVERFDLERNFIQLRIDMNKSLNHYNENQMRLRIAESYEDQGDSLEKKNLGQGLIFYANAFMNYLDLGEKEKLDHVKSKLKQSGQITKQSLKPVPITSFKLDINNKIELLIKKIDYSNVLHSIVNAPSLFPTFYVPRDEELGIGVKLFPTVILDDYDNVSAILEWDEKDEDVKEEWKKYRAFTLLKMEESKYSRIRFEILRYLIDNDLLSKDDFFSLVDLAHIDDTIKERLKFSVNKYFEDDFIASAYVLTLQFEPLLITLVRAKTTMIAISHKRNRRGATQETTLGTLFNNPDVRNLFVNDFYNLLNLYFIYDLGLNFRNEIAHGQINHKKLTEEYCATILIFLCKILFLLTE